MSGRLFICMAADAWLKDPVLNYLPDDCYLLADRIAKRTDGDWRLKLPSPHDVIDSLRSECFGAAKKMRQRWDEKRIARAFELLLSHDRLPLLPPELLHFDPVLTLEPHGPEKWVRLTERLRYHKGDDGRLPAQPNPTAQRPLAIVTPFFSGPKRDIPLRSESEESRATESARARDSGTRERSRGKDSESRFARGPDAVPDPLWSRLWAVLGKAEMYHHGACWVKRYNLCRDALNTAVSDYEALTPAGKARFPNAASYVNTAFETEKRARA